MKRNVSDIAPAAMCLAACMMAAFALADCAIAAPDVAAKAEDKCASSDKRLCELRRRCDRLVQNMDDALVSARKETRPFTPPLSASLCAAKKVAAEGIREFQALRADVEKEDVPAELSESKTLLLKQIEAKLSKLKETEEMTVEDVVEMGLRGSHATCKEDDTARGWSPLALSLVPACEFPCRNADVYGIRLNLIGGSHHDVTGLDVGSIFNSASNCLDGVQIAGLVNFSRRTRGMQFAGLFNGAHFMSGMQCAGGINFVGESNGIQMSGLLNIAMKMHGCQIAGSSNFAALGSGCQLAGWANLADKLDGVQLSAINIGEDVKGLQIGVLNVVNTMSGCQIGLCNVIKTSPMPVLPVVNMFF